MTDHDSLGALQIRVGTHGRGLALDPYGGALAFLRRGFTGRGGAISLAARNSAMSAGNIAQAVQGSAYPDRYDAVAAQARQYLARGGRLRAFAKGGSLKRGKGKAKSKTKPGLRDRLDDRYDVDASDLRSTRRVQTDRVGKYDDELAGVETLGKDYGLQERRNDLTEEVLVNEETGDVNWTDVKRRAAELQKLIRIRSRIWSRLKQARTIGKRVVRSYGTVIKRLTRARSAARRSKSKKGRKAAVAAYSRTIKQFESNQAEWKGKLSDLGYDIADARLDVESLAGEHFEVVGTRPNAKEPVEAPDAGDAEAPTTPPVVEGPTGTTEVQVPATPAEIAMQAMAQVASFNASRADLFGSQGSNFAAAGTNPYAGVAGGAAGSRYFGGAMGNGGGPGTLEAGGVGAQRGNGDALLGGAARGTTVENMTVTFGAPVPDLHVAAQTLVHELKAA